MTYSSFVPTPRTLMGPGPSDIDPRVAAALSRPLMGHLDPEFVRMMDEIKSMLQVAFQTSNALTLPISAPGSAGMEACFVNLVEPGDKVIVCINGVFGNRMKENVIRCGAECISVEDAWGTPVSLDKLQEALKAHPDARVVAFVHAETSTGVRSDAAAICALAKQHDCLTIMDTVTGLGGIEVNLDSWGVDATYSGTQKCLSCPPGISPVSFSEAAVSRIKARTQPVQSWFLDMNLIMGYWGEGAQRAYHHTAPVNALYGLHEALVLLLNEGLEQAWARHQKNHLALRAGLENMGLRFAVAEDARLPQLNAVLFPDGVEDAPIRKRLLNDYHLEIGAGLGQFAGKLWRIGLMGYASNPRNVRFCVSALSHVLNQAGHTHSTDAAMAAVEAVYA